MDKRDIIHYIVLFILCLIVGSFIGCTKEESNTPVTVGPPARMEAIDAPVDDIPNDVSTSTLSGGYSAAGTFSVDENGIVFYSDFNLGTAPGPVWYLSNSSSSVVGGVRLGEPGHSSGAHRIYTKEARNYAYLVLWCEPFSVRIASGTIPTS